MKKLNLGLSAGQETKTSTVKLSAFEEREREIDPRLIVIQTTGKIIVNTGGVVRN